MKRIKLFEEFVNETIKLESQVLNEWGSSDQNIMNKAIHKDAGSPKKMPSPFDSKLRAAAEDAVDFYWDDWEEYQTDRDGLIDNAVRSYLRSYFKKDFEKLVRMFESVNENLSTEQKMVEKLLKKIAKEFDYSMQDAARFVLDTIGKMGLKESVNEAKNFKKAKQVLIDFNNGKLSEDDMVKDVIKALGFKFDEFSEEEAGSELSKVIRKGKIPTDDYVLNNIIDVLTESMNEGNYDAMLDKLADIIKGVSFMNVGKELKKNGIKYSFSTSMIPMYKIDKLPIAIVNKKYAAGAEREVGDIAIGLLESINEEATEVTPDSKVVVDDYLLDDAETEIKSTEIIGAIVSANSEDEFLDYFYKEYGNGAFTESDISKLIAYYQDYREEVNAAETEAEEEAEGGDEKDPLADLGI
jgi:hypothetical protein